MTSSLIDIRKRITSTRKTSQITSAMQMVSAAKLNRIETRVKTYRKYAQKIREIVTHLAGTQLSLLEGQGSGYPNEQELIDFHDMLIERPVQKTGYLVISSDKGLAGSYNSSIFKAMRGLIRQDHASEDEYSIFSIGENLARNFAKEGMHVAHIIPDLSDDPAFDEVREVVANAVQYFREGEYDELYVCYNHHVNALVSEFRVEKMLPLTDLDPHEAQEYEVEYLFEPTKEDILEVLLPQYAESLIYGAIIDAKAAEHASRMTAMKSATENATKLIDELTVQYNRARQTAITQEITEIIGGAEALED